MATAHQTRQRSDEPCVAVANEPRAYREVMAEALRELRPDVNFVVVEPERLTEAIQSLQPDLVICEKAILEARGNVAFWLELCPGQGSYSVVWASEKRSKIENVQLSDIIGLIDRSVNREAE